MHSKVVEKIIKDKLSEKVSDLVCRLVKNRQLLFHLIQSFQGILIYCSN